MGNNSSRNGDTNRKYVYAKQIKAKPTAYVPPDKVVVTNGGTITKRVITNGAPHSQRIVTNGAPVSQRIITREIPEPEIKIEKSTEEQPSPKSDNTENGDVKTEDTEPKQEGSKINGYVKNNKHSKKPSDHIVHKERSYKLYDPEYVVSREGYRIIDQKPEIINGRSKSYMHYEQVKPEYVVREKGYKMYEPRYTARRVAHTYATVRRQPEVITSRPAQEIITTRPKSEIIMSPRTRPVRVIRSVPPVPLTQTVRAQTIGRPVIVRRSLDQEKIYATPDHGYIPRHRLGEYRPKVIDGYVAPSRIGGPVFSDLGGYREVRVEPIYQTVKKISPPAYPGRPSERDKVTVDKDEKHAVKQNFVLKAQTDDEKLKDVPLTQYIDDGKTIMIIDYLLDPFSVKKVPPTVQKEINQKGEVVKEEILNGDLMNGGLVNGDDSFDNNDDLNSSFNRQRDPGYGDVAFLP